VSPERREEQQDFIANFRDLGHLPEEVALLGEHVYTKVEDRYSISNNQVTIRLFSNREKRQRVIFRARNDEGAEPRQVLLPEYMCKG